MILIDTSIWIDHFRLPDDHVIALTSGGALLAHPYVVGEIMLGNMRRRLEIASLLSSFPSAVVASPIEVQDLIELRNLAGKGIGYVDTHLLASTLLTTGAQLWTRDKRLAAIADDLGVAHPSA